MKIKSLFSIRGTIIIGLSATIIVGLIVFLKIGRSKQEIVLIKGDGYPSFSQIARSTISKAESRSLSLKVSGITEPFQDLDIEFQLSGTIEKIFIKEGAYVKKGTFLMKLSVDDRAQKLESAKALVKLRKMQYLAAKRLSEKDFTSPISLADAERNLSEAKLALSQAQLGLDHLIIKAPFEGIVNQVYVEEGATISPMSTDRKACKLINLDPLYLTVYVTEKIYDHLHVGSLVNVQLADGRSLEGKIDSFSVIANPQTRTFQVRIIIPNPGHLVPGGMTGVVEIPLKNQITHKLNPSWVTLSKDGIMGVMAIKNGLAVFYPVTLVDSSPSFFYVSGLPDQVEIITLGQESFSVGAKVESQRESDLSGP